MQLNESNSNTTMALLPRPIVFLCRIKQVIHPPRANWATSISSLRMTEGLSGLAEEAIRPPPPQFTTSDLFISHPIPIPTQTPGPLPKMQSQLAFLLLLLLPILLSTLGVAQLLLPSTHSSLPLATSRRPCSCPGQPIPPIPVKNKAARAKAHHRPQQEDKPDKSTALVLDQSLLGALQDVGQRLEPFKSGKGGKGKKRKGAGRTRRRHRPKREANEIVDPALAGPEGTKCNSERIRRIIRKAKGRDSAALKRNIQALAERTFSARFNVVCARGDFSYISNTEEFCQERVNGNSCYVFRQLGRDLPFPEPPQLEQFERSFSRRERKWKRKKAAA